MTDPVVRWCKTHDTSFGENCRYPSGVPLNGCVIVDAVVLVREPCVRCGGKGFKRYRQDGIDVDQQECLACGGSGTTWPDELIERLDKALGDPSNYEPEHVLDALALVVQEGTDT